MNVVTNLHVPLKKEICGEVVLQAFKGRTMKVSWVGREKNKEEIQCSV
jgi:hypothetical protein